jgi:hypothetical protein
MPSENCGVAVWKLISGAKVQPRQARQQPAFDAHANQGDTRAVIKN